MNFSEKIARKSEFDGVFLVRRRELSHPSPFDCSRHNLLLRRHCVALQIVLFPHLAKNLFVFISHYISSSDHHASMSAKKMMKKSKKKFCVQQKCLRLTEMARFGLSFDPIMEKTSI